jgi:hypothetical protein
MTVDGTLEDHRVRCQPYLLRLRMIARDDPGLLLTQLTVAEVIQATEMVLAEAEAAGGDVRAAGGDVRAAGGDVQAAAGDVQAAAGVSGSGPGAPAFLRVRLNRLAGAANDAIAAAGAGDSGQLRGQLRRFDVLTAAIWTVHQAIYGPAGRAIRPRDAGIASLAPVRRDR